jgi:hypothetical protein
MMHLFCCCGPQQHINPNQINWNLTPINQTL